MNKPSDRGYRRRFRAVFRHNLGNGKPRVGVVARLFPSAEGGSEMTLTFSVDDGLQLYKALGGSLRQAARDGFLEAEELLNEAGAITATEATVRDYARNSPAGRRYVLL